MVWVAERVKIMWGTRMRKTHAQTGLEMVQVPAVIHINIITRIFLIEFGVDF
jgi:hypothetical protein